jgi:hypothetical protein
MLYSTEIKVAVKDVHSKYNCIDTSIFQMENTSKNLPDFQCKVAKAKEISITIKCPICGEKHEATYALNEFLKRQMIIGGCEATGMPVYFVGKPLRVSKFVNKYNEVSSRMYAML